MQLNASPDKYISKVTKSSEMFGFYKNGTNFYISIIAKMFLISDLVYNESAGFLVI